MAVQVIVNDLVRIGIKIANDPVVEIGIKSGCFYAKECSVGHIDLFQKVQVYIVRFFGFQFVYHLYLPCPC
ncbi:hypothetical protein D3C87_1615420 [compost metagenome]